jgi:hypothetical protein
MITLSAKLYVISIYLIEVLFHSNLVIHTNCSKVKKDQKGVTIPDLKIYYRAITIKAAWYQNKKQTIRPMDQN